MTVFIMKRLKLQVLSLVFVFSFFLQIIADPNLTFFAIKSILEKYIAINHHYFYILQTSSDQKEINDILTKRDGLLAIEIVKVKEDNLWVGNFSAAPTVAIFDSAKIFNTIFRNITWMNTESSKQPKHFVHIKNSTLYDLNEIVKNKFDMNNVNFLLNESEDSIDLVAPHMYSSSKSCERIELITVNRFHKKAMQWENLSFGHRKYQNLNGCTIKIPSTTPTDEKIFEIMADELNFKIRYVEEENDFDIIGSTSLLLKRALVPTVPIAFIVLVFVIPPGDLYTPFEKMWMMFDFEVWMAIAVTLSIALGVIQIVNLCSSKIQNFVFGRNIRTPTLNLQATFLAGGQFKVPGRNFARFLLMLFIIWSMIIRTCYQSELFKHLQADTRKPRIKRMQELFDNNFTFYRYSYNIEGAARYPNTKYGT